MTTRDPLAERLAAAGFVAPEEEAAELRAAGGDLDALAARRLTGEPLAWITGTTRFCGLELVVHPGVYVPRPQTELIAERAAALLPPTGTAIDACCGCGAIAAVLTAAHPDARVLAYDVDPRAVACARENGVDAQVKQGAWPLVSPFDLVVAVAPYVPTDELRLLHRDTLAFEPALAYDGGDDGLDIVRQVVREAQRVLKPGGALVLELGRGQPEALGLDWPAEILLDEDGDVRGLVARRR